MKIKAVCEITGLTDRTIRYYITENLISPSYTENYLGRKTFNFSENDVKELNDISVLRKFGFSIVEIREIILYPDKSTNIIQSIKSRKENTIQEEQSLLSALSNLDTTRNYTIAELAEELSNLLTEAPITDENIKINIYKIMFSLLKSVILFFITWLPVLCSCFMITCKLHYYQYPVFDKTAILINILTFIPTMLIILLPKLKISWNCTVKRIIKCILIIFCILVTPISLISSLFYTVTKSETTSFRNYRDFDTDCFANRNLKFQELFPTFPHYFENEKQNDGSYKTVYLDSKYYYRYIEDFDYTYDIYAEWTLEENAFQEEIIRVTELAERDGYTAFEKGDYKCIFLYGGYSAFKEATDNYDYLIFAYNKEDNRVRYIHCCSLQNGSEQPYYLSLDWGE
ncbi:MAG: MerR family transcriptional regulator [Acutalibacteraceae bacterium]|nr:MerR family transcriptional regulator [Acutalibacteraceae bacterium]